MFEQMVHDFMWSVNGLAKWLIGWLNWSVRWLYEEPNVKNRAYYDADEWGDEYMKEYLPDKCQPDPGVSELVYEYAVAGLEECAEAYKSLTTKCADLMKLLVTIVGAFLALWRYSTSIDTQRDSGIKIAVLFWSNCLAALAIICLIAAIVVLATCLRGMPFIPKLTVRSLLDWAGEDKENADYLKQRAAIRIHRAIVGNWNTNNWIHRRADLAWRWTIAGLIIITGSVILRLFA